MAFRRLLWMIFQRTPVLSKRTLYINANQVLSGLSPGSPLWFAIGVNWMMLGKSREVVQKKDGL
jgi:hypothetical protein